MRRTLAFVGALSALTLIACAPARPLTQAEATAQYKQRVDYAACERDALRALPDQPLYTNKTDTHCTGSGNSMSCTSEPRIDAVAQSYNASIGWARGNMERSCMIAKGYRYN